MIKRRRKWNDASARNSFIRWLETDDATKRRGTNHRADGLRAERDVANPRADRGGRSTARTARRVTWIMRVARWTWREICELGRDCLAENQRASINDRVSYH